MARTSSKFPLMDQLSESLARKITLKQGEDELIAADPSHAASRVDDHSLSLVGRVVIDRELSITSLRANIRRLLNPVKGVDIKPVGPNTVLLRFTHPLDRKHAMGGSPWVIDRHALLLEPLDPTVKPEKQQLTQMPIVVRIMQLSLSNRTDSFAKLIGDSLGRYLEVPNSSQSHYTPYFRIKVAIDVTRPLKRGIYFQGVEGTKEWLQVLYERLPAFCFLCGIMGHGEAKCPTRYEVGFEELEGELPFGSWMRANLETHNLTGAGGLSVRVTPVDGILPHNTGGGRRGSEIFSVSSMRRNKHIIGDAAIDENADPNLQPSGSYGLKKTLTLGSPSNSANSVASSASRGRRMVVVPSHKRKAKDVALTEAQKANKKVSQYHLRDEADDQTTAEAVMQPRRDQ